MRTRTKDPDGFIDGARRDRCAIVAEAVREWRAVDTNTAYIKRGSPWENGHIESFNARLRNELLDGEIFYSLREAPVRIAALRPRMSFDYKAPAELFLAKPMKGSRTKYQRFATAAEAIRYAVEDLRTPRALLGCRLETSASTVPKSSSFTRLLIIRCGRPK